MSQRIFQFANGYDASVIDHGYGSDEGYEELAVMRDGDLDYTTPLTADVLGWLTSEQVVAYLWQLSELPALEKEA